MLITKPCVYCGTHDGIIRECRCERPKSSAYNLRCNRCHVQMPGTTSYDGACVCGGLIEEWHRGNGDEDDYE